MKLSVKVKNWPALFSGVGCLIFGGCSIVKADFHMSNYALYLTGTHARVSGALLAAVGLYAIYCGIKKSSSDDKG